MSDTINTITGLKGVKLTSTNYVDWKYEMEVKLQGLNTLEIATGDKSPPPQTQAKELKEWKTRNAKGCGALHQSIDNSQHINLGTDTNSLNSMWTSLIAAHSKKDASN